MLNYCYELISLISLSSWTVSPSNNELICFSNPHSPHLFVCLFVCLFQMCYTTFHKSFAKVNYLDKILNLFALLVHVQSSVNTNDLLHYLHVCTCLVIIRWNLLTHTVRRQEAKNDVRSISLPNSMMKLTNSPIWKNRFIIIIIIITSSSYHHYHYLILLLLWLLF